MIINDWDCFKKYSNLNKSIITFPLFHYSLNKTNFYLLENIVLLLRQKTRSVTNDYLLLCQYRMLSCTVIHPYFMDSNLLDVLFQHQPYQVEILLGIFSMVFQFGLGFSNKYNHPFLL